jgi:hypothetical protein
VTSTQTPFKDQRRGRRYRYKLPVDLHSQRGNKRLWTHDVGNHGIFLLMKEPPRERHVLKLTIYLPEGPVGTVAHGTHTSPRGMGVQFFALSREAKLRWDRFLAEVAGDKPPEAQAPLGSELSNESATFVVKLKTKDALRDFVNNCVSAGGTYLRTPVLKEVGAHVTLTMVHPVTEREFPLAGRVVRLHQKRPKGMEIHFFKGTLSQTEAFDTFIETGERPDINVDDELELVVDSVQPPPSPTMTAEGASVNESAEEDVLFDIDVLDDTEVTAADLDDHEVFDWVDVDDDLLIDIGIGDELDTFHPPPSDPGIRIHDDERTGPVPVSQEGEPVPHGLEVLAEVTRPFFQVNVACNNCDMMEAELDVGGSPGVMGAVSRLRPYFCPSCKHVVTRRRPIAASKREEIKEALGDGDGLDTPVPMRLLFEVAELDEPLRCPHCDGKLKMTKATKALENAIDKLEVGEDASDVEVPCSLCREGRWSVERSAPLLRTEDLGKA